MPWYNPRTWQVFTGKGTGRERLTLDQLVALLPAGTAAGERVTPETAIRAPTISAIVGAFGRVIGQLPVDIVRKSGGRRSQVPGHELAWLLNTEPNQWQTAYDLKYSIAARLVLYGEAIHYRQQAPNGRTTAIVPIAPAAVSYEWGDAGELTYTWTQAPGRVRELTSRQVWHIRCGTIDGMTPIRLIDSIAEDIALEIAATKFGARFFGNDAMPNLVLKMPGHFKDTDARNRFKRSWDAAFRKKRGTAVLEDGLELEQVQINNEESQFLETRKHQRTVIAGAFGIPPHRIGDLERATFSNIEQQNLEFLMYALTPFLVAIEQSAGRDLLPPSQRIDHAAKFNVDALMRGDSKSRAETLQIERNNGILTANEWRALLDREPRTDPGGDEFLTPLNMRQGAAPDGTPADSPADPSDEPAAVP